jgi:hypothetical protein
MGIGYSKLPVMKEVFFVEKDIAPSDFGEGPAFSGFRRVKLLTGQEGSL